MLLQQIATKQLTRRPLRWNQDAGVIVPEGNHDSPWRVFSQNREGRHWVLACIPDCFLADVD